MYPAQFDYRRAESIDEALGMLAEENGRDVQVLAGGHGLIPAMKSGEAAPDVLVDIGEIERLRGIDRTDDGDTIRIGALATHADVASSDIVASEVTVLQETALAVADMQIRTRGTVGGNFAEADPEADLPAAILALDGTIHVSGPDGSRTVPADVFFDGNGRTALDEDELLTEIDVRVVDRGAYLKKTHPARGYAMVGVAAAIDVADGHLTTVRVAAVGVSDRPVRLRSVEEALTGEEIDEVLADDGETRSEAASTVDTDLAEETPHGDAYASDSFRAELLPTYVERAVGEALATTNGGETR